MNAHISSLSKIHFALATTQMTGVSYALGRDGSKSKRLLILTRTRIRLCGRFNGNAPSTFEKVRHIQLV